MIFFKAKKWNSAHWPSQLSDLNPNEVAFQLLKVELEAQCPKQAGKEYSCRVEGIRPGRAVPGKKLKSI